MASSKDSTSKSNKTLKDVREERCYFFDEGICTRGARCQRYHDYSMFGPTRTGIYLDYIIGSLDEIMIQQKSILEKLEKLSPSSPNDRPSRDIRRSMARQVRKRSKSYERSAQSSLATTSPPSTIHYNLGTELGLPMMVPAQWQPGQIPSQSHHVQFSRHQENL